jgi:hypothetical protein
MVNDFARAEDIARLEMGCRVGHLEMPVNAKSVESAGPRACDRDIKPPLPRAGHRVRLIGQKKFNLGRSWSPKPKRGPIFVQLQPK